MQLWLLFSIPVLVLTAWFYTANVARKSFPRLRNKAIVLLIAHPDDEAMFFSSTLLGLTHEESGNHVKILCLSNGNADGIGSTRQKEILDSGIMLGLRSKEDILVYDDPRFPDSMTKDWNSSEIVSVLDSLFTKPHELKRKIAGVPRSNKSTATTIDVLITFDRYGISNHPNHYSLYHGAVAWFTKLRNARSGIESPLALYTLTSTNVFRKYVGVLDAPLTMIKCFSETIGSKDRNFPARLMFLSDLGAYRQAQKAMTTAHVSQMRWFRWGWITIGRYMTLSDLKREKLI